MPLDIILHGQPVPDKKPISMVTMRQRTLLESNEEWAHIFATHNPGFFMRQGDGQHPEVRCIPFPILLALLNFDEGALARMLWFESSRECASQCWSWGNLITPKPREPVHIGWPQCRSRSSTRSGASSCTTQWVDRSESIAKRSCNL